MDLSSDTQQLLREKNSTNLKKKKLNQKKDEASKDKVKLDFSDHVVDTCIFPVFRFMIISAFQSTVPYPMKCNQAETFLPEPHRSILTLQSQNGQ